VFERFGILHQAKLIEPPGNFLHRPRLGTSAPGAPHAQLVWSWLLTWRTSMLPRLLLTAMALSLSVGAHAQADRCDMRAVTDRIWDQPSCPSGACRTLLLRGDGTYQIGLITLGSPPRAFCESGQWQQVQGRCDTIRLRPCKGSEQTRSWRVRDNALVFGESSYSLATQSESTAFTGCTVRRLCDGLSCGEYLACLQDCSKDIFPDPTCPSRCLERVSPSQQETASLRSCAQRSGCTDDACLERVCAAEMRACVAK
jgi:hypothetical protein